MRQRKRISRTSFESLERRSHFSTTLGVLPSPWTDADIGAVGKTGSAGIDASGNTVISGGGADVWGSADAFNFDYQPLAGDGTVVAHFSSETDTSGWAKAGVMIRTDLSTGSPYGFLFVSPSYGISFQARATAKTTPSSQSVATFGPRWLELVRSGQQVSGYFSSDDVNWTPEGVVTLPAGATVYAGVAVCAHNNSALCTATFSNLSVNPAVVTSPGAPTLVAATANSSSDILLQWTAADSLASSFIIERQGPSNAGFVQLTTVSSTTTSFDDTSVSGGSSYGYEIFAVNAIGPSVASLPVSATTPAPSPAPGAPIGVAATAISAGDVHLQWTAADTLATSFVIDRQGPTDAAFVQIATLGPAAGTFDDTTTTASTLYTYEVFAVDATGSSPASAAAAATTPAAPVSAWSDSDIGAVGVAGSASQAGGVFSVSGSGTDIWSPTDIFNLDSQTFVGNGAIVARVLSNSSTDSKSKAGIMFRETNAVDSRFVDLVITQNTISFQYRSATHTTPSYVGVAGKFGTYLKLTRIGNVFNGAYSTDGVDWTSIGSVTISMVNNIQAGLCVCSHNNAKLTTAKFDNVTVTCDGATASIWSDLAAPPLARWEAQSVTYDNKLYILGGFTDRSLDATAEVDVYDPVANSWSTLAPIPTGPLTHAGATIVGDTLYLAGGDIGTFTYGKTLTATSQVLTYNFDTNTWGSITALPTPVACGGFVNINNVLYYYGGLNANDTADVNTTYAFDLNNPAAGWVTKAPMPDARNHVGYAAINGIAYAIGGQHGYAESKGNDAEVDAYNPVTNVWTKVASLPQPWSSFHVSTLVVNNKIVILGGQTNGGYDGIYQSGIEEFDPVANTWTNMGNLPEANEGLAAAYVNGQLLGIGGTVDNLGGWATQQTWSTTAIAL